jgi:hypothetical protein
MTYRCSNYRPKSKEIRGICTSVIKLSLDGQLLLKSAGEHFCRQGVATPTVSAVAEMRLLGEERALTTLSISAKDVYETIYAEMLEKYGANSAVELEHQATMTHLIQNTRTRMNSRDKNEMLSSDRYAKLDDGRYFLHHISEFALRKRLKNVEKMHRMIIWADPRFFSLLRENSLHMFLDGTFRIVPVGFYQMLVLMVYNAGTKVCLSRYN